MAKTAGKVVTDPKVGEVLFRKSIRARRVSIRVHPFRGVSVTVPYIVPYAVAEAFFRMKHDWVLETMERLKEKTREIPRVSPQEIEALRRQAKEELPKRLAELAARYGFQYNKVTIKHNATNWGSCSAKNNINLNLNIVRLPKVLQDYILLHELCHLRHRDHGPEFHRLLERILVDNVSGHVADGDALAGEFVRKSSSSKACNPLERVMSRSLSGFRIL